MNNEQNIKTAPAPASAAGSIDTPPAVAGAPSFRDHLRWIIADLERGDSGTGAPVGDMIRFIDAHCAAACQAVEAHLMQSHEGLMDAASAKRRIAVAESARAAPAVGALTARTDKEIVQQTEALATALAAYDGYVSSAPFAGSVNPRSAGYWQRACITQEVLTATDPNDAVDSISDDLEHLRDACKDVPASSAPAPTAQPGEREILTELANTQRQVIDLQAQMSAVLLDKGTAQPGEPFYCEQCRPAAMSAPAQGETGEPLKPCSKDEWAAGRSAAKTCERCDLFGPCTGNAAQGGAQ